MMELIIKIQNNLDVNTPAEINAKMMLKFVSSTSVVGVKLLPAVGDSAGRQIQCIEFRTKVNASYCQENIHSKFTH